ncbi:MAG: outer membrane lipoprotein-sorting protein [Deltaproteobacteria bacterium]|nr:outer membrane lipoprotein-sorting protein [Deltaproteobacteria bacterium]
MDGSESVMTLTIINKSGQKRVRKLATVSRLFDDGTEKRIIRFIKPADVKGAGLLTFDYSKKDDDMWFFMPSLRKTRRIVASEKAKNFMGSEFTYADIAPSSLEDFTYKVLGSEKVDGVDSWILEARPKTEDVADKNGYSRRVAHIGKKDFVIRRATYYDLDGELHKEFVAKDIKEIDTTKHRFRPLDLSMTNKQNGRRSVMTIDDIKLRTDVPDDYFTTRSLERF